ncbi:tocopherol o-methyltransferase [Quercus suber]|uniref:Tocopherol o-methyltransferase n=1 Tax=Quercus suber TaxID=58331 RepID=A0AAW0JZ34_QUESU
MTTTITPYSYLHTCQFPTIQRLRSCQTRHRFLPSTCAPVTRKLKLVVAEAAETTRAMKAAEDGVLKKGIAEFYDESSGVWEDIWGDHMHHGFYDPDSTVDVSGHRAAQIRMIDEALRFAGVSGWFLSLIHSLTVMQSARS